MAVSYSITENMITTDSLSSTFKLSYYLLSLSVLLVSSVCVEANYDVSISMYSFNNPTSKCATCNSGLGCCDNHDNTGTCTEDELCDPGFDFCLIPLNKILHSHLDCITSDDVVKSTFRENVTTIFGSSTTFASLNVPFQLSGITNEWQGIKLYIWASDVDNISPSGVSASFDDDTIDEFYIPITSPIGILTPRRVYHGINGLATIDLSYRVTCAQYYYGEHCEHLNECELNSVTCNGQGQCEDGVDSFTCVCEPKYAGSQCQFLNGCYNDFNSAICSGNGQCFENGTFYICACDPGYTGTLCDQVIVYSNSSPGPESDSGSADITTIGVAALLVVLSLIITVLGFIGVFLYKKWNKHTTTETVNVSPATMDGNTTQANTGSNVRPPGYHPTHLEQTQVHRPYKALQQPTLQQVYQSLHQPPLPEPPKEEEEEYMYMSSVKVPESTEEESVYY